ncbi:MAG: hypothetical protein WAU82_07525 [Candidatus Binatus sp.]|uniref:hypothetical protein n=1 Tax=Candidatus Binatus sp. TaxID=2811406 RepID=UPI003BAE4636
MDDEGLKELQNFTFTHDPNLFGKSGKVRVSVLDRDETSVPIHVSELREISSATAKAAFWWSIFTLALGSGLSLFLAGFSIKHPDEQQIALTTYAPICCGVLAMAALVTAVIETVQRNKKIDTIERECGIGSVSLLRRFINWRKANVQAKNNSLLLSSVRRVSPEDASALSSSKAPSGEAAQSEVRS